LIRLETEVELLLLLSFCRGSSPQWRWEMRFLWTIEISSMSSDYLRNMNPPVKLFSPKTLRFLYMVTIQLPSLISLPVCIVIDLSCLLFLGAPPGTLVVIIEPTIGIHSYVRINVLCLDGVNRTHGICLTLHKHIWLGEVGFNDPSLW
jgi:hypothetical protein